MRISLRDWGLGIRDWRSALVSPFLAAILAVGGCDSPSATSPSNATTAASSSSVSPSSSAAGVGAKPASGGADVAVSVKVIDRAGLNAALEKHHGNVVLVDFWATWCSPCVKLFPHSVELQRKFADKGLSVNTVSFDDPDDQARVLEFLKEKSAITENYISSLGASPKSADAFGLPGPVPCFQIYDKQGKLSETLVESPKTPGAVSPEKIDEVVNRLLAE